MRAGLAAVACAAALSACAGSGDAARQARSEQRAFIARADRICDQAIKAERTAPGNPLTATAVQLPAWADYLHASVPALQQELAALKALKPPKADAGITADVWSRYDAVLGDGEQALRAVTAGDVAAFRAAARRLTVDGPAANDAARSYGLIRCGGVA